MPRRLDRERLLADQELTGVAWCRAYGTALDAWLAELFGEAGPADGMALVAVGGTGRSEPSPHSDLDVVLVHDGRSSPDEVRAVAEAIWYPIWDEGLRLGHAVRTVSEALGLARQDLGTATALLATRWLAGDERLAEELFEAATAQWRQDARRRLGELGASVADRHAATGDVAFRLEPDLKEGRGGLRDVQALEWAERGHPMLVPSEQATLRAAYETVLAIRVELHRITGRPGDQLRLEDQDAVAAALGAPDADALMGTLASAARDIAWISDDTWARIEAWRQSGPGRRRWRRRDDGPAVVLAPGLAVRDGAAGLADDVDPSSDPLLMLRLAVEAARHGYRLDHESLQRLAEVDPPEPFRWTEEARRLFIDLLMTGEAAVTVIEALDRTGLWAHLLPEWEPVRCRPQRNVLHTFTVDRHLEQTAAYAAERAGTVERPDLLVLGALLHDIGKGYPGDHVAVGVDLVRDIGGRMGYPPEDVVELQELVRHHLLLPDVATRRDLDDEGTIAKVADAVENRPRLERLHALAVADAVATGPAAWTDWKAGLVEELVARTVHHLEGGRVAEMVDEPFPTPAQLAMVAKHQQVIEADGDHLTVVAEDRPGLFSRVAGVLALHGLDVVEAAAHCSPLGMALEVFRVESPFGPLVSWAPIVADLERSLEGRLALTARLAERARRYAPLAGRGRITVSPPVVLVDNDISELATVLEVQAADGIGVLYRITQALTDLDLDVRAAKIHTLGNEVVDAFYVRDRQGAKVTDPTYLGEIERGLVHALNVAW